MHGLWSVDYALSIIDTFMDRWYIQALLSPVLGHTCRTVTEPLWNKAIPIPAGWRFVIGTHREKCGFTTPSDCIPPQPYLFTLFPVTKNSSRLVQIKQNHF